MPDVAPDGTEGFHTLPCGCFADNLKSYSMLTRIVRRMRLCKDGLSTTSILVRAFEANPPRSSQWYKSIQKGQAANPQQQTSQADATRQEKPAEEIMVNPQQSEGVPTENQAPAPKPVV